MDIACTKTNRSIVPIKIFEAEDGFLPRAFIVAYPRTATTADGPRTTIPIVTNMIQTFILSLLFCLHLTRPRPRTHYR